MEDKVLEALELAEKGQWDASHTIVQQLDTPLACWLHACLHREEGDLNNASYWYRKAGEEARTGSFEAERAEIRDRLGQ